MIRTRIAAIAIAAALCVGLTACKPETSELLVSYATMKVIERGSSAEDQAVRARKIRDIATDAKSLLAGEKVTLGSLEQTIRAQVEKLDLELSDRFLADALISQVVTELEQRVGTGVLDPDRRYKVTVVLDWVIDATAYGGAFDDAALSGGASGGG